PAADENEHPDEEIEQPNDPQIVFGCERLFAGGRKEPCFAFLTTARQLIAHLGPEPGTVQPPGNFRGSGDRGAIDSKQEVARTNPRSSRGRIGRYSAGLNTVVGVQPGYSVVYDFKAGSLVEVNQGKNHRRQRGERQYDRPKANSEVLPHKSKGAELHPRIRNQVQTNVHSLVEIHWRNSFIFNNLQSRKAALTRIILFLEGQIQLSRTKKFLELNAEPTSKCPECGY